MRLLLLFLCLLPALAFSQPPIRYDVVQSGQYSNITTEQFQVFQTEGQFVTYWKALTGDASAPKDIKWANEFVIAVNLGNRNTGGYKVFIESIERVRGELVVTVVEMTPRGATTDAITSPFEVVRVQRTSGNVRFNKVKRQSSTGNVGGGGAWDRSLRWRNFMTDTMGGGSTSREMTITNAEQFRQYWKDCKFEDECPVGDVRWSEEMLVAIHLGNQTTAGYNVLVEAVDFARDGIVVSYIKQVPATGQLVSKKRTSPYIIVRVPRAQRVYFSPRTWASEG